MLHLILFIGVVLLIVIFVALTFVISLVSRLFGGVQNLWKLFKFGRTANKTRQESRSTRNSNFSNSGSNDYTNTSSSDASSNDGTSQHRHGKKVFSDDEGEYVDFVEIKD